MLCGRTFEWVNGKVAHLQNHMFACGCSEERVARTRWATAIRTLTKSAVKHDRADEVSNAVMAFWGAEGIGDIAIAAEDERHGWQPTEMAQGEGDQWHFSGTTTFDENAHWGAPPRPTSLTETNLMSRDTYAPRTARCPMTRTGTGLTERRTR